MSKRIHYKFDGTKVWRIHKSVGTPTDISQYNPVWDGDMTSASYVQWEGASYYFTFNFPDIVRIDKICIKGRRIWGGVNDSFDAWVSTNSTNGWDGSWTQVLDSDYTSDYSYSEYAPTMLDATWLRLNLLNWSDATLYCVHLFGEYQTPRFEFWDSTESAELTDNYPWVFPDAPNLQDYSQYLSFKIKNTHSTTHSYSVTVNALRYGGDLVVLDHFKLSKSPWSGRDQTVYVSNIAASAWSEEIRIYVETTIPHNPADGIHYFAIDVTETE